MTKLEKSQQSLLEITTEIGVLIPEYHKEKITISFSVRYNEYNKELYSSIFISDDDVYSSGDSIYSYDYKTLESFIEAIKNYRNGIIEGRNKTKIAKIKELKKAIKRMEQEDDK